MFCSRLTVYAGVTLGVANHLGPHIHPHDRSVTPDVTLLPLEAVRLARDCPAKPLRVLIDVLGVGQVAEGLVEQLFPPVAEHPAVRLVHAHPPPFEVHHRHPDRRSVKRRSQESLRVRRQGRVRDQPLVHRHVAVLSAAVACNERYRLLFIGDLNHRKVAYQR